MAFRDIRRSRKWLSVEEIRLLLLALILLVGLLALNIYLARTLPGGEQFFLRWSGARTFLLDKLQREPGEPYSATVAERTQNVAYGRQAFGSEYPYALSDPFYITLLYIPLALFSDFAIVRGVWMLLSELILIGVLYSFIRSLEWEPPTWLYILLLAFGVFGYYSLVAFRSGTPAIAMLFLILSILYALRSFSDEVAGALLFLIAYQWEVSALFFLFVIVFVFANRRWRVLSGFGMVLAVLGAISFLSYPGWGLPYVRGVLSNWYRSEYLTFGHVMSIWFPHAKFSIGSWVSILLGAVLFLETLGSFDAHYRRVAWTVCLSLAAAPLMGGAIFLPNYVVLLPSLILIVMLVWERWTRQRVWYVLLIILPTFAIPFWLYFQANTDAPRIYFDLLNILPPIATIIGLYWMRWWAFRTPRTWFDQIGDRK
ncbi:MAG: hypothetical protein IPP66_17955 [Anaerolineales bacterium]|nr:hypothetical protein [Anaerolineales bacterium]